MKNYIHKWQVGDGLEWREVPEDKYTERQKEHKEFIDMLSAVVKKAKCGWDEVRYKVVEYDDVFDSKSYSIFMVLCVEGHEERWIPINGNSMGCNLSVLGENIW